MAKSQGMVKESDNCMEPYSQLIRCIFHDFLFWDGILFLKNWMLIFVI